MRYLFITITVFCINYDLAAQNKEENKIEKDTINKVYMFVEKMPEFSGGQAALLKYILSNFNYPNTQAYYGGTIYVRFVVDENGNVIKPEIIRGIEPILDKEALRVIKTLPKWKPGELNGKKVKVWYNLPIHIDFR